MNKSLISVINLTKTAGACTELLHTARVTVTTRLDAEKQLGKFEEKKENFKCVLIDEKVLERRSIRGDCKAGDVAVKWVKKLRVERGDASLLSGDKCK